MKEKSDFVVALDNSLVTKKTFLNFNSSFSILTHLCRWEFAAVALKQSLKIMTASSLAISIGISCSNNRRCTSSRDFDAWFRFLLYFSFSVLVHVVAILLFPLSYSKYAHSFSFFLKD